MKDLYLSSHPTEEMIVILIHPLSKHFSLSKMFLDFQSVLH